MRAWLATRGGAFQSLRYTIGRHGFDDPERLQRYLDALRRRRRVVHGHTPHWDDVPISFHGGLAVGYDGRFSRFWGRAEGEEPGPIGATVALLPPLAELPSGVAAEHLPETRDRRLLPGGDVGGHDQREQEHLERVEAGGRRLLERRGPRARSRRSR